MCLSSKQKSRPLYCEFNKLAAARGSQVKKENCEEKFNSRALVAAPYRTGGRARCCRPRRYTATRRTRRADWAPQAARRPTRPTWRADRPARRATAARPRTLCSRPKLSSHDHRSHATRDPREESGAAEEKRRQLIAYPEGEFARVVVHAAREHEAERVAHRIRVHHTLAGERAVAAVRERRRDHGARLAVDLHRTELRIERISTIVALCSQEFDFPFQYQNIYF